MSGSDEFPSRESNPHVTEELAALIAGELDLGATRDVTRHLRSCSECQQELVEVVTGIGLIRRLDDLDGTGAQPARPHVAEPARTARSRVTVLAAAAVVLVLVGVVAAALTFFGNGEGAPDAKVALTPVASTAADGSVAMRASGSTQAMEVDTTLGAAPTNRYYEVWLLDRQTGKMLPVGVLPPEGHGTYRLPEAILDGYDSVDISLQRDDGTTEHSSESVLRANYS